MRRIAIYTAQIFQTILNVSFLAILFTGLLIGANFFIAQSFAQTVSALPPEPAYCKNLTTLTCQEETYASRKQSILEYSGRCLKDETAKAEGDFLTSIAMIEGKVLKDPNAFKVFFDEVKNTLISAMESESALSAAKKNEFRTRLKSLRWLSAVDHIKMGGVEEFKKTCGESGLEENASYTVFASGAHYVVVCPGRFIAAMEKSTGCYSPTLNLASMIYTLSHEIGHSIGGNFFTFDSKNRNWIKSDDSSYLGFQSCMMEKFSEFQLKDYGEASADYWASKAMARYFEKNSKLSHELTFKSTMAGLCGTSETSRHLPGNVRIQDLIGGQIELRTQLGCLNQKLGRSCQI